MIAQPNGTSDGRLRASLESALFDTGRPVLVAPLHPRPTVGRRIAIAWNGSPKASRAVAASLPFLGKAEAITVLTAPVGKQGSPGEALAAYLSRHGIKASVESVDAQGKSAGKAILEYAQSHGVDL